MSLASTRKKSYNYCDLSHVMFHFIPLFSSSTLTGIEFWDMPLLVKWKKFILCSHIGLNNHVAYPSWIWYIWNDFVLISCTNEMARLSYSKEPSLSLLCTHIMLMESVESWKFAVLGFIIELLRWIFVSKHERTRCYYIHGLVL